MSIKSNVAPDTFGELALARPSGLASRVAKLSADAFDDIAASLTPQRREQALSQSVRLIHRCKSKLLESRLTVGAVLYMWQQLYSNRKGGGFAGILKKANLERRHAYRCIHLYQMFAPYCDGPDTSAFLRRFSLEAADILARPTTPPSLRQRFIEQAVAGSPVTYRDVKAAVRSVVPSRLADRSSDSTSQPWLEHVYRVAGAEIQYKVSADLTSEQLRELFTAALRDCHQRLPPRPTGPDPEASQA